MSENIFQQDSFEVMWKTYNRRMVYIHIPNEAPTNNYGWWLSQLKKGMAQGASDWIIAMSGMVICIELKWKKQPQSDKQVEFEKWCNDANVPYFLVRCNKIDDGITEFMGIVAKFYEHCRKIGDAPMFKL